MFETALLLLNGSNPGGGTVQTEIGRDTERGGFVRPNAESALLVSPDRNEFRSKVVEP